MSIDQVSKSTVLIAGAGIGGLAMALSLLRRGIDCDALEPARRQPGRYREQYADVTST